MAEHAYAAGDAPTGPRTAGCSPARRRCAARRSRTPSDLFDRSLAVGDDASLTRARALLARGAGPRGAHARSTPRLADVDAALALAHAAGDRRLEMAALRARGGDVAGGAAAGRPRSWPRRSRPGCGSPPSSATGTPRPTSPAGSSVARRPVGCGWPRRWPGPSADRCPRRSAGSDGRARARSRRPQDRLVLPRRPGAAAGRGRRRARAAAARAGRRLAAAVDGVRGVVRRRGRGRLGRGPRASMRRGAGGQPAQRLPGATPATSTPTTAGSPGWPATSTRPGGSAGDAVATTSPSHHPWWYAAAAGLLAATLVETGDRDRGAADGPRAGWPPRRRTRREAVAAAAAWPPLAALTGDPADLRRGHRRCSTPSSARRARRGWSAPTATCSSLGPRWPTATRTERGRRARAAADRDHGTWPAVRASASRRCSRQSSSSDQPRPPARRRPSGTAR